MGNVTVTDRQRPENLDRAALANRLSVEGLIDAAPYLTPHSDIVALMVLEHQTKMHNLITAANYHARSALHYEAGLNKALDRPAESISASTMRRIHSPAEKLVKYLLVLRRSAACRADPRQHALRGGVRRSRPARSPRPLASRL